MASHSSLAIPSSTSTLEVSIIDTTARITDIRATIFMEPCVEGFKAFDACAYSFLITRKDETTGKQRRLLFDLGIRKDWVNLAPMIVERVKGWGCGVEISKSVAEILTDNGVDPASIEAIIWSHAHWDHIGDISTFPASTTLLVGPGIASTYSPGYPTNPKAPILATDLANRTVTELSFSSTLSIGALKAIDFFGDGSFYLLDAPGHAIGHLNALARTTEDTFLYLGADSFHHGTQLRPNEHTPLPAELHLSTPERLFHPSPCPAELLTSLHPAFNASEPFTHISVAADGTSVAISPAAANETIRKIQAFDANENIFVIAAHDMSLLDLLDFFPKNANGWKGKGWKEKGRWRYLTDYGDAIKMAEKA